MSEPTRGAEERQWQSRTTTAWILRVVMFALPIAVSILTTLVAGRIVPRPAGMSGSIVWWLGITAVSTVALALASRSMRRFLPVVTMLRLSLVFPDAAPSRFGMALRTGTVKQFKKAVQAGDAPISAQLSAETLLGLSAELGNHDRLTRGHSERVRAFSNLIAQEMKLSPRDQDLLHWSALLHDIGKLDVPAEILNKPGRPDAQEWAILQAHPAAAERYLEPLADWLGDWRLAATQHHERFDGDGYPHGLAGRQISLAGRIVAVADAYDTITSVRSYKHAMSAADARAEITRCSGTQFDPAVVRAFLSISVGNLQRVMGPLSWLAQLPVLASAPSTAVPVLSNAVVSTVAAGTVAMTALAGGVAAAPNQPVDSLEAISAITQVEDAPDDLRFAALDQQIPTPAPTSMPTTTSGPRVKGRAGVADEDPPPAASGLVLSIPTPTSRPTATGAWTPPPQPTAPVSARLPTPTPTVHTPPAHGRPSAPTPTRTPTPAPPPPSTGRYYLDNPGSGNTSASPVLALVTSIPDNPSLPNYDVDRDSLPGLRIRFDWAGLGATRPDAHQLWTVNDGGRALNGPASLGLFAMVSGQAPNKTGIVLAAIERCSADLGNCTRLASASATFVDVDNSFVAVDLDFGQLNVEATPSQPLLVLRLATSANSDSHIHYAYDTTAYPAYLDLGD